MYSVLPFDELNKMRSMPFDQYFGEMDLTQDQEDERIALARSIEAAMLYFFDAVVMYLNDGVGTPAALLSLLIAELMEALDENDIPDKEEPPDDTVPSLLAALLYPSGGFSDRYAVMLANELFIATFAHKDDPYFLSRDRARLVGEEESNTVYNHIDYIKAIVQGKTKKTWVTQHDPKVRATHRPVDGVTIPISEFFQVGGARMLYPRDVINGANFPEEIAGCRCWIKYS